MMRKHPARKEPITSLTEAELQSPRKGINSETFRKRLKGLNHDVAPGIGGLRNEHLLLLLINPDQQMTPSAAAAVDHLYDFSNAVVKVEFPSYFYTLFVACCIVPANKINPADLSPGIPPDFRPVNISRSDRRLFTQSYFNDRLQETYNSLVAPIQNGVGISGGISITSFGVHAVLDANPGFGVIQVDIKMGITRSIGNPSCSLSGM